MTEPHAIKLEFGNKSVNFQMDLNSVDADSFEHGQMYEPNMSSLFAKILDPGDIAIDVGANVGWFTVLSASLVGPEGRVYAFEPAPDNITRLEHHVSVNNFKNVEIVKAAASDVSGTTDLYLNPYGNGGHSFYNMQEGRDDLKQPEVIPVNRVTLNDYFRTTDLSKLKLMKIDTEGHDVRVLVGATEILEYNRPPYIFSELHGGIRKFNDSQIGFFNLMREYGYSPFLIVKELAIPLLIPPGTQIKSTYALNLLFSTPENLGKLLPVMEVSFVEPQA